MMYQKLYSSADFKKKKNWNKKGDEIQKTCEHGLR